MFFGTGEFSVDILKGLIENGKDVVLVNVTKNEEYALDSSHLSDRQRAMLVSKSFSTHAMDITMLIAS